MGPVTTAPCRDRDGQRLVQCRPVGRSRSPHPTPSSTATQAGGHRDAGLRCHQAQLSCPLERGLASSPQEPPDPCLHRSALHARHQRADGCVWFNDEHGSMEVTGTLYLMFSIRCWWDSWVRTMQRA